MNKDIKIAVIGLGYVGLPLAVEFSKKYPVIGYDINQARVDELNEGYDSTLEVADKKLKSVLISNRQSEKLVQRKAKVSNGLYLSTSTEDIKQCNIYIVAVPTPLDDNNRPNLTPLHKASESIGKVLNNGDIVIYESTVYPGATEEECVPVLEKVSGLRFNEDFYCGYSPERINPGDKVNTFLNIKKVTAGSSAKTAKTVDDLYNSILLNGTYKASSIKVAEASKVIENAQRDLNISFVNELALIFDRMGIDTTEVIEAAGTKWNFLKYKPGLVGGHCIVVDPYYLTFKAESLGYQPDVILSGRRVNNNMGHFIANKVIKLMIAKDQKILNSNVLVLGVTFKENCPDIRNTKVIDVIHELKGFGCNVDIYDPWANPKEVKEMCNLKLITHHSSLIPHHYSAIILAVAHNEFLKLDFSKISNGDNLVIYDTKSVLPTEIVDGRL